MLSLPDSLLRNATSRELTEVPLEQLAERYALLDEDLKADQVYISKNEQYVNSVRTQRQKNRVFANIFGIDSPEDTKSKGYVLSKERIRDILRENGITGKGLFEILKVEIILNKRFDIDGEHFCKFKRVIDQFSNSAYQLRVNVINSLSFMM